MSRARNASSYVVSNSYRNRKDAANNRQQLMAAIEWLLEDRIFKEIELHGNTSWDPCDLVVLVLLWMWSEKKKLTDAFVDARSKSRKLIRREAVKTYQGLMRALKTWTPKFIPLLQIRLHNLMEEFGAGHFRVGRWVPIAIDGSRATTPRTKSNEQTFCAKNYGKGNTAKYRKKKTKGLRRRKNQKAKAAPQGPQMWVTLMWHINLGIPWCWKLGPSNSAERAHVTEMIESGDFAENTLFVGDAGFVGYEFLKSILDHGHQFLVRVGGNVRLLTDLGFHVEEKQNNIVYCWPADAMKKNSPPLVLRLVECMIGSKKVYLLTSVTKERHLTKREMARLYKQRWGVELEFRALKQTFERRVLRCREGQRTYVEMEWSIFTMTITEVFALKEQLKERDADPIKLSFAQALSAIRSALDCLSGEPEGGKRLQQLLRTAVLDTYKRSGSKEARYKPNKKDKPSCGRPIVARASPVHRTKLAELELKNAA
jgi:hypothetical protein